MENFAAGGYPIKYLVCLLPLVLVLACTKGETPTGPTTPAWFYFDFTGYGETLEPNYIKIYSDSSWEKYRGIDTVKGTGYISAIASDSTLYYYTVATGQYAGYKLRDQDPIIFDAPSPFLPTRWPSDTTFARTATFTLMGYSVAITDFYTLIDTTGIVTPLGKFSPAPHFLHMTYIKVSDGEAYYGSQELWAARGPGVIITEQQGQPAVYFIRGFVNGKTWDSSTPVQKPALRGAFSSAVGLRGLLRSSTSALSSALVRSKAPLLPTP